MHSNANPGGLTAFLPWWKEPRNPLSSSSFVHTHSAPIGGDLTCARTKMDEEVAKPLLALHPIAAKVFVTSLPLLPPVGTRALERTWEGAPAWAEIWDRRG